MGMSYFATLMTMSNQKIFLSCVPLLVLTAIACGATTTSLGGNNAEMEAGAAPNRAETSDGSPSPIFDDAASPSDTCERAPGASLSSAICPAGKYCRFDGRSCSGVGHCVDKPSPPPPACPYLECGCDQQIGCPGHESAGIDLAKAGYCSLKCGDKNCDAVKEYCVVTSTTSTCTAYPSACDVNHSCACLQGTADTPGACTEADYKITIVMP